MAVNPLTTNLSNVTTGAGVAASLAGLALVTPSASSTTGYQPLNPPNSAGYTNFFQPLPPALLFHYEGENTSTIESDITDHWVENNSSIVDQIALRPEIVTVSGFIGELNNVLPPSLQILQNIANNLVTIDAYTPQLSATALNAYNQALLLYENATSIVNSAISVWSSITGSQGEQIGEDTGVFTVGGALVQNKQQQLFQQFYGYWNARYLFNIQTPWAIFTNMAILNMRSIQSEETKMISNYQITFKKIRTASTSTSTTALSVGRAATQSSPDTNSGTSSGEPGTDLGTSIQNTP